MPRTRIRPTATCCSTASGSQGLCRTRSRTYGVSLIVPLIKTQTQHIVSLGYQWQEVSALTEALPSLALVGRTAPHPAEGVLARDRLSYLYNNAQRYDFSISPEDGRTIELGYERFDKSLGKRF